MKLTFILLTATFLQLSATGLSQNVTISVKNAPIERVFREIERQTGIGCIYTKRTLDEAGRVTIDVKNATVAEVLKQCFSGSQLAYSIKNNIIVITKKAATSSEEKITSVNALPPPIEVKGTVTDEDGKPIKGASVTVKGTKTATATNENGEFSFSNIDGNSTLVISSIGYETSELKLNGRTSIEVHLIIKVVEAAEVVISTGVFKKADKSFTGASTTVTAKELQQFGNKNLITSLRNIDPSFNIIENNALGSNPNRLPDIQIRGNSSLPNIDNLDDLAGLNTPLVILDGFQSTLEKLLDINVNEVESLTILKDAAATAIYGSRGSNGVIVIITKQPLSGELRISYRGDLNIESADLSDYNLLNARQKLDLEQKVGFYNHPNAPDDIRLKQYYNYLLDEVNRGVNTNWLELPLQIGFGQRHNFSINGGEKAFRFGVSANINNTTGAMKGSSRKVFNGTVNLAYVLNNIRFSNQLVISERKSSESSYGSFSEYAKMNPYWRPFDDDGNTLKILGDPGDNSYRHRFSQLPTNPMYNSSLNTFDKTKKLEIINNTVVEVKVFDGFLVRTQFGITKNTEQLDKFRPADHTAFANYSAADVFRKGDYSYGVSNGFNYDGSLNLQYSKQYNKQTIFAGLDYNIRQEQFSSTNVLAEGFTNPDFDFIGMALQYAQGQKPSGAESLKRSMGLTANLNYDYDDRYFADVSVRMDGSSQFGKNNRMAPFWATGLGWNLHNESFLKGNKIVNKLKLRTSVGVTGSQNFQAYQALSTYRYFTDDRYFNLLGAYLLGIGNEDLKWQQSLNFNLGFNAEFLNGRIQLTGDYYKSETGNLLSSINLPASNGFPSYTENVGKMTNKGFELKGTGMIIRDQKRKIYWSVTAGIIQNKNKIVETSKALKDAQQSRQLQQTDVISSLYFEGYSTGTIWVVPSIGIDPSNGKEVYLDKDNNPTYVWNGNDIRAMGNVDPDYWGNFSSMVRYKGLTLNMVFGYRFGGQAYNQTLISKVENANYSYNVDSRVYNDRWEQPGDQAAFKGLLVTTPTYRSSRFVQNDNTLMCQNIYLEYLIRSVKLKKYLNLSTLQINAGVADPFRISTIRQERGTQYPFSRQFNFSISATF